MRARPVHTEFRDDRFIAAFERRKDDSPIYTVAYIVRAVSPGDYVLPQAMVEDMYRPDRFGRTGTGAVDRMTGRDARRPAKVRTHTTPASPPSQGERSGKWKRRRLCRRCARCGSWRRLLAALRGWFTASGPAPLGRDLEVSTPGGRPQRQIAARLSHERRPLAAAGHARGGRSALSRRAARL